MGLNFQVLGQMRNAKLVLPSNRKFGLFFTAVFAVLGAIYYEGLFFGLGMILLGFALLFLAATIFVPGILKPLNILWMRLGMAMAVIVNPIVMGLIFFCLITPVSIVTRLFGRDELRMKARSGGSCWIRRDKAFNTKTDFKRQF